MNEICVTKTMPRRQGGLTRTPFRKGRPRLSCPPARVAVACVALAGNFLREGLAAGDFDREPDYFVENAERAGDIAALISTFRGDVPELKINPNKSPSRLPSENMVRREWSHALFGHAAEILREQVRLARAVNEEVGGLDTTAVRCIAGMLAVVEKLVFDVGEGLAPYPEKVYGGAVALAVECL